MISLHRILLHTTGNGFCSQTYFRIWAQHPVLISHRLLILCAQLHVLSTNPVMAENGEEKTTVWRVFLSQFTGAYKGRTVSEGNRLFTLKSLCGETEINLLPKDAYALNGSVVWKQTEWGGETGAIKPGACAVQQLWLLLDASYQTKHFKGDLKKTKPFKRNCNFVCMQKFYCTGVNKTLWSHPSLHAAVKVRDWLYLYSTFWYRKRNNLSQEKLHLYIGV